MLLSQRWAHVGTTHMAMYGRRHALVNIAGCAIRSATLHWHRANHATGHHDEDNNLLRQPWSSVSQCRRVADISPPRTMWGRCGTIVASMQLGRTPPLLTVPSLSDRLSHSPPTSSSSLSHFYEGSMWDDSRLHAARSYTSSPDSPFSLRSSFTQSAHLFFIFIPLLCGADVGR